MISAAERVKDAIDFFLFDYMQSGKLLEERGPVFPVDEFSDVIREGR